VRPQKGGEYMEEREELVVWKCRIRDGLVEEAAREECFFHRMFLGWLIGNGIVTSEDFEQFLEEYALWNIAQEQGHAANDGTAYGNA